jgi:DNA-binding NarL/FixJ family response regulator
VLHHLVHGRLNKQIAHDLDVSLTTVKAHVSAILQKLGVFSRTQAVILANRIQFGRSLLAALPRRAPDRPGRRRIAA